MSIKGTVLQLQFTMQKWKQKVVWQGMQEIKPKLSMKKSRAVHRGVASTIFAIFFLFIPQSINFAF